MSGALALTLASFPLPAWQFRKRGIVRAFPARANLATQPPTRYDPRVKMEEEGPSGACPRARHLTMCGATPLNCPWFAGANADAFDGEVSAQELQTVLQASPWRERIPDILLSLKDRLRGASQMRLSSV